MGEAASKKALSKMAASKSQWGHQSVESPRSRPSKMESPSTLPVLWFLEGGTVLCMICRAMTTNAKRAIANQRCGNLVFCEARHLLPQGGRQVILVGDISVESGIREVSDGSISNRFPAKPALGTVANWPVAKHDVEATCNQTP